MVVDGAEVLDELALCVVLDRHAPDAARSGYWPCTRSTPMHDIPYVYRAPPSGGDTTFSGRVYSAVLYKLLIAPRPLRRGSETAAHRRSILRIDLCKAFA